MTSDPTLFPVDPVTVNYSEKDGAYIAKCTECGKKIASSNTRAQADSSGRDLHRRHTCKKPGEFPKGY